MILTLSIKDRVQLEDILHTMEGRRIETIIIESVLSMITFTADEVQVLELKDLPNGKIGWNAKKGYDTGYQLTTEQVNILKKAMDTLDQRGKFNMALLPLDAKITTLYHHVSNRKTPLK